MLQQGEVTNLSMHCQLTTPDFAIARIHLMDVKSLRPDPDASAREKRHGRVHPTAAATRSAASLQESLLLRERARVRDGLVEGARLPGGRGGLRALLGGGLA